MRKTIYILLGLAFLVVSCTETPANYAVVSGKIKNGGKELELRSADMKYSKILKLGEDGSFSNTIREKLGRRFMLNGLELYLDKGSDITINADAAHLDNTLAVSGKGSGPNEYLILKRKIRTDFIGKDPNPFYRQQELEFKEANARIRKTLARVLDSMKGEISGDFMQKERRNLDYDYLKTLYEYEGWHGYVIQNRDFKVSDGFLDEPDNIDYNRGDDYTFSRTYRELLGYHYGKEARKLVERDSLPLAFAYLKALAKGNPSPGFTDYENYAGGTTSLDDLKGKYVYIDVWATWCGPCKAEIPFLKEVEEEYRDKNIEFVSISIDQDKDRDK